MFEANEERIGIRLACIFVFLVLSEMRNLLIFEVFIIFFLSIIKTIPKVSCELFLYRQIVSHIVVSDISLVFFEDNL